MDKSSCSLTCRITNGSFGNGSGQNIPASQRYEKSSQIGKGAYSVVYKGADRQRPGEYVAMKEVKIHLSSEEGIPMTTIREIGLLRQLDKFEHPNVVRLLDVVSVQRTYRELQLMLIFEHIDQDLAQYLDRRQGPLESYEIKNLFRQILSGVDFIHTHRVIHRDLKPQNILVRADGQVKLADFGLARVYGFTMALTSVVVTLYYRSPEVLLQDTYSTAVDIWSCGCIFAELHTRKPLFAGASEVDQLVKIFEVIGLPCEEDWPEQVALPLSSFKTVPQKSFENLFPTMELTAKDLLQKMLTFKQTSRISAFDALRSAYFSDGDSSDGDAASDSGSESSYSSSSSVSGVCEGDLCSEDEAVDHIDQDIAAEPDL